MAIKVKAKISQESSAPLAGECLVEVECLLVEQCSVAEERQAEVIEQSELINEPFTVEDVSTFLDVDWKYLPEHTADSTDNEAEPHTAEVVDLTKLGWHSPSYSTSRSVTLDPETLQTNRCIAFEGDMATIDSYKVIRARILERMKSSNGNTLMVTSVLPGEGKTTTAINLAFIMAKEFQQTVLLVDCDLQQQDIHKRLGYQSDKGLINYLLDDVPLPELFTWPGVEKITLISGGRTIRDSSELLGSPRMKELVTDMKTRYPNRFVIFDMQSTFAGADTLVFSPLVDNILLVIQEGNSSTKDIKRAISLLPEDKLLGLMLNRHKAASHIVTRSGSQRSG